MVQPSPSTFVSDDDETEAEADRYALVVVKGPDRGRRFVVEANRPSRLLVGTGEACEFRLGDRTVSRRHLAVDASEKPSGLRITDLESTNGTWLGAVRVYDVLVRGGEQFRIGESVLTVEPEAAAEPALAPSPDDHFGALVGRSLAMRRLYPLLDRLAASDVPILVEGETGTGKEVLAEALHEHGPRASGPFVVFDCTTVPAGVLESELFGHERGAFTGAVASRKGVFEQAHQGTLLIDEIGDLEAPLQPKLLRALERREIRRVGGDSWIEVDVRVIAATRRDLDREVEVGRFRDDLYHRLVVGRVELPPLRERHGDVGLLARHFWADLGGAPTALEASTLARWESERWPGNVRELRNAVARHLALGDLERFAPRARKTGPPPPAAEDFLDRVVASGFPFSRAREEVLAELEQRYVTRILAEHGGDVTRAAAAAGVGKRYFQLLRARHSR